MKVLLNFAFLIFKILCLYKRRVLPKSLSPCVIHSIFNSSKTEVSKSPVLEIMKNTFKDMRKYTKCIL